MAELNLAQAMYADQFSTATSENRAPLIGTEEIVYITPLECAFFTGLPYAMIYVESPEGILPMQTRCWWEPIEDEE